ncbi:MAG TPA: DUF4340 domain-containing protein [Bacteroidales bacterium]|nr:DUF4340 domain-containing protein [Bacteroidales bacterium]HOK74768.1 DUF4340 domain-containing protein [Bacteroidales bacterium]HOM41632.1 DUF4340 domain-containing protein [Bacteroidales bacterium]HPP93283.1 DUF4340 domain-containing protein [Bacteroidales bacterium]
MSKRFENKTLLYILGVLLLILLITFLVKIPREKSTLETTLVRFDTAQVARIIIKPKSPDGEEFQFVKENGIWKVTQGKISSSPRPSAVSNILSDLLDIRPSGLVAVDRSKWPEYDVTDSLGIRVRAENKKGKALADVVIGKFSYKPVQNPYGGYGGGSIDGVSYVRLYNEDKVYAVDGFLTFSFTGGFDDYRDKTLVHATRSDITKISFTFPADTGFVLEKKDNKWMAAGIPADSTRTSDYLSDISYIDGEKFADDFKPVSSPVYKADIEGNNLLSITIKCYRQEDGKLIINSSLNPDSYFETNPDGVFGRIFKPLGYFTPSGSQQQAK